MYNTNNKIKKEVFLLFIDDFHAYKLRISKYSGKMTEMTEEATKNALIMPFFILLGYDVFNPDEIMPEYTCDVATKKGEKIDYAIMHDGDPIILIEAKRAGLKLQKQQQGQLYRYFSTNHARLAILTNGVTYNFYSDINSPNIMDDEPFLSFNVFDDDEEIFLSSLEQFHRSKFNIKEILSKAVFLKYVKVVEQTIKQDLISPSDELVKYFLMRPEIRTGNRITAQIIEKHRAATAETMRKVFGVTINTCTTAAVHETPTACLPKNENSIIDHIKQIPISLSYIEECQGEVGIIYILKDGDSIGRIRYSKKRDFLRMDYTNFKSGKISFVCSIDECKDILEADIKGNNGLDVNV